jgi:hypothetical protein
MKDLNICIREVKHGQFKGTIDIIFLDYFSDIYNSQLASFGHVGCIGTGYCHSSGDFSYFRDSTKNADINNPTVKEVLKAFKAIYESSNIIIKTRLTDKLAKEVA